MELTLGFFGGLGTTEVIVILVIALLIFGRRLPEVGRSMGKGIIEFKKGLQGIEDEVESAASSDSTAKESKRLEQEQTEARSETAQAEKEKAEA